LLFDIKNKHPPPTTPPPPRPQLIHPETIIKQSID